MGCAGRRSEGEGLEARGRHLLIDIWGVSDHFTSDTLFLLEMMVDAATAIGARVVDKRIHPLPDPPGVTGVVLLDESHISCHTYADRGWMAIDIFVCGEGKNPYLGWELMRERLGIQYEDFVLQEHSRFFAGGGER